MRISYEITDANGLTIQEYKVNVRRDGSFKFKVGLVGDYCLKYTGMRVPDFLHMPNLWGEEDPYFCKLERGKEFSLGEIYLTEPIEIFSPKRDSTYSDPNEIVFSWEEIPFANFYHLFVDYIDKDEGKQVLSVYSVSSSISFEELLQFPIVNNKLSISEFMETWPHVLERGNLGLGQYIVYINARKLLYDKKEVICVGMSSDYKTSFIIEKNENQNK